MCQSNFVDNDQLIGSTEDAVELEQLPVLQVQRVLGGRARDWSGSKTHAWRRAVSAVPAGEVVDLTVGLNYRPAANVVVRPELRWDDYHETNTLQDTFLFGIDTVITY